jgi:hypothetical protein
MSAFLPPPSPADLLALVILAAVMAGVLGIIHWVLWLCGCYT